MKECLAGADESMRRAMEQRSLGHAMHTLLVEFLRSFLRTPALEVRGLPVSQAQDCIVPSFISMFAKTHCAWVTW